MFRSFLLLTLIFSNLSFAQTSYEHEELYNILSQKDEKSVAEFRASIKRPLGEIDLLDASYLNKVLELDKEKSVFIPLELTNKELITLAAATSLGVIAFRNDQEISDTIQKNNSTIANTIADTGNFLGEETFGYVAAGSYFLGVVMENNKLKKVGLFILGAELAQGIITTTVKNIVQRSRPHQEEGPYEFGKSGHNSFWSGHTATSFALATVLSEEFKDEYPLVPYVAYGLAAITAYGRVHSNNHWASDVIMGAIAGHLIGKLSLSFLKNDGKRGGLTLALAPDAQNEGLRLTFKWTPKTRRYIFH